MVLAVAAVIVAAFAAQLGGPPESGHGARENPAATTGERGAPEDIQRWPRRGGVPICRRVRWTPTIRGRRPCAGCASSAPPTAPRSPPRPPLADRPVVLNLWAYWCAPCGEELPAMAEYQRRAGPAVTVVTVHQDENEGAGLQRLAELGVRLPTFQDGSRRIAAALHVPNVMPATVVLRRDGTVAEILPRAFVDADEIAAAVGEALK